MKQQKLEQEITSLKEQIAYLEKIASNNCGCPCTHGYHKENCSYAKYIRRYYPDMDIVYHLSYEDAMELYWKSQKTKNKMTYEDLCNLRTYYTIENSPYRR